MDIEQDNSWTYFMLGTVVPAISVVGIVGNILNLFVLTRLNKKDSIFIYFTYLAASDLMTCSLLLFGGFVRTLAFLGYWWKIFRVCVFYPICNISMSMSALIIVMLTAERIIIIQNWNVRKKYCTQRTAHQVCLTIIPLCCVFNIPVTLEYRADRELGIQRSSFISQEYFQIINWIRFSLFGVAITVFLTVGNILLICSIRRNFLQQKALIVQNKRLGTKRKRDQTRLAATLIGIIVMFLLGDFTTYLGTKTVAAQLFYGGDLDALNNSSYDIFSAVLTIPMAVNYSFNFILYCTLNSQFLTIVKEAATCRRRIDIKSTIKQGTNLNKY